MNFNKNIKQVSEVKVSNLMVLPKHSCEYLIQVKNLTLKIFQLCLLVIFDRSNIFDPNWHLFLKFESSLEVSREKRKFSDILS